MLVVNGANIVQSFFVISGFLIAVLFENHVSHAKNANWSLLVKAFVLRYIRFAPLIFLTMLIHATWLYRFGSGPFWDKVTFAERQYCRNNWWTNVLFLDNYINVDEKCLIHSWYLAVDFWLSFIATAVLIAIKKYFDIVLLHFLNQKFFFFIYCFTDFHNFLIQLLLHSSDSRL